MLRRCSESLSPDFIEIGRSVTGVAFLATPHQGAQAAKTLDVLVRQFLSKQAKQLAYGDDNLVDLNDFFRSWVARQGVAVRAYFEPETRSEERRVGQECVSMCRARRSAYT